MSIETFFRAHKSGLLVGLVALVAACSGTAGPIGPTGPKGDAGVAGPAGNANVKMFTFGSRTSTAGSISYDLPLTQAEVDSSAILVYYNPSIEPSTSWYSAPGLSSGGLFDTRWFLSQTSSTVQTLTIRFHNPGSATVYVTNVTLTKVRIVLTKASTITANPQLMAHLNDYAVVKRELGLQD